MMYEEGIMALVIAGPLHGALHGLLRLHGERLVDVRERTASDLTGTQ